MGIKHKRSNIKQIKQINESEAGINTPDYHIHIITITKKIICLTVFDGQSGKIEEVSFSLTFAPDITEKEIFNLEQIIKNQLFSFEDTNNSSLIIQ